MKGTDLGFHNNNHYVLHYCVDCGKQRWVIITHGLPSKTRCRSCSMKLRNGSKAANWKGGITFMGNGKYVGVYVEPNNCFYRMADKDGYVMEHRLVMAKHLGRCLDDNEVVHHINHDKTDNNINNLRLMSDSEHKSMHAYEQWAGSYRPDKGRYTNA